MKPDIHVFRAAPNFITKNADGEIVKVSDEINVRIIDTNIYLAIRLSIVDAQVLVRNIQAAIDKRMED